VGGTEREGGDDRDGREDEGGQEGGTKAGTTTAVENKIYGYNNMHVRDSQSL